MTLLEPTPTRTAEPAWSRPLAVVLAAGGVLAALGELTGQVLQRDQADGPAARVAAWVADPTSAGVAMAVALLCVPLLVLSSLVTAWLTFARSPRLAAAGGSLLVVALVGLAAIQGSEQAAYWMVLQDDPETAVRLLEVDDPGIPGIALIAMLLLGALLGSLALTAALWREGGLLRVAAVAKLGWLVGDFVLGWPVPAQCFAVASAALVAWVVVARSSAGRHGQVTGLVTGQADG